MTKFILMLATVFGLSVIVQAADPTSSPSPNAKVKTTQHHTTQHHKIRQHKQMTGS